MATNFIVILIYRVSVVFMVTLVCPLISGDRDIYDGLDRPSRTLQIGN